MSDLRTSEIAFEAVFETHLLVNDYVVAPTPIYPSCFSMPSASSPLQTPGKLFTRPPPTDFDQTDKHDLRGRNKGIVPLRVTAGPPSPHRRS